MKIFLTFLTLLIIPFTSFANVEEGIWSYVFHLESVNGTLSVRTDTKTPYSPVPILFTPVIDVAQAPFYGIVLSVKGKTLEKFGIPPATTVNTVTGKSEMEVSGPYFADAERVAFYTKEGKHLFDISVKGSSFCNDDNKCNVDVGENYINCPLDCPAPIKTPSVPLITPPVTPIVTTAPSSTEQVKPETPASQSNIDASYITTNNSETPTSGGVSTKALLMFGAGLLMIILGFAYYRIRQSME